LIRGGAASRETRQGHREVQGRGRVQQWDNAAPSALEDPPGTLADVCGRTTSTTPRDRLTRWLDVEQVDAPELCQPPAVDAIRCQMVSTDVNSAHKDGPELVTLITPELDGSSEKDATELLQLFGAGAPNDAVPPRGPH
jgi:hypothetical protein